jgi:hypothetical protein
VALAYCLRRGLQAVRELGPTLRKDPANESLSPSHRISLPSGTMILVITYHRDYHRTRHQQVEPAESLADGIAPIWYANMGAARSVKTACRGFSSI